MLVTELIIIIVVSQYRNQTGHYHKFIFITYEIDGLLNCLKKEFNIY